MREIHDMLNELSDYLAKKYIQSFELEDVYKALVYSISLVAALKRNPKAIKLLDALKNTLIPFLRAQSEGDLRKKVEDIVDWSFQVTLAQNAILTDGLANLEKVVSSIRKEIGTVDHVLIIDGMSIIEELIISAFLKNGYFNSFFLSTIWLNPVGLTRYMTRQAPVDKKRPTLRDVAGYLAQHLNAEPSKLSYVDEEIHRVGPIGIEEFVKAINIRKLAECIQNKAKDGSTLILADHGYDIVALNGKYLYVVHGFSQTNNNASEPLLLLSRFSVPLVVLKT